MVLESDNQLTGKPKLNKKSQEMIKDKVPTGKDYTEYLLAKGKEYEEKRAMLA